MDKDGKDVKNIRLATGWEKAPNGKWRYEIQDGSSLSFLRFKRKLNISILLKIKPFKTTLGDFYNNPELFKAYPQLKDMNVFVHSKIDKGNIDAYYSIDNKNIHLALKNSNQIFSGKELRRNLIHEIQHAIQDIEGFDLGDINDEFANVISKHQEQIRKIEERIDELDKKSGAEDFSKKLIDDIKNGNLDLSEAEEKLRKFQQNTQYSKIYKHLEKRLENIKKQWSSKYKQNLNGDDMETINDFYERLGSEIEARNAENRADFTTEERRNTPLYKTQDTAQWITSSGETYNQAMRADTPELNAREQLNAVRKRYEGTDQWLKAPNGKKSNLNERQWLQVRTPNFKRWFGDWENDPKNASIVVDKNGEPLVVYHGTPNGAFNSFKVAGEGFSRDTGAWFTSDKNVASLYTKGSNAGRVYALFLNIRNPYVLDAKGRGWNELVKVGRKAIATDDIVRGVWQGKIGSKDNDGVIIKNVVDPYVANDLYVLRNPNNIKSATHNKGSFGDNAEIYNQFMGVKGARMADAQEGVKTRMDNYKIAKLMKRKGFSDDKIWLATGWWKAPDKHWRMDLQDGRINKHVFNKYVKAQKAYEGFLDKYKTWFYNSNYTTDEADKLIDKLTNSAKFKHVEKDLREARSLYLPDYYNNPALYDAYPQFKKIKFELKELPSNNNHGYYNTNIKTKEKILLTKLKNSESKLNQVVILNLKKLLLNGY